MSATCFAVMILVGAEVRLWASEAVAISGRLTVEVDGVVCEYSPGREDLARALAERFAERNREASVLLTSQLSNARSDDSLSPADLRAHRKEYLAAICAQLALPAPTEWQEECYDAFLNNYESHMLWVGHMRRAAVEQLAKIDRITLWDRLELVQRLEAGEAIQGFSYDSSTKQGRIEFGWSRDGFTDERLTQLNEERKSLQREYSFRMKQGPDGSSYRASSSSRRRSAKSRKSEESDLALRTTRGTTSFPMVIPAELAEKNDSELAEQLWRARVLHNIEGFSDFLKSFAGNQRGFDPNIAFLVFHETTEVGVVEHYYQGKDRRWFCDGVANYVPWRIVRDRHGSELANQVYNLAAQLVQYRDVADRVNLQSWAAVERQDSDDQESRMNSANYAFAARVIFLMHERQGDDVLPRLFKEVGRTKPAKVAFKTLEKAWKTISGGNLRQLMDEAVRLP